MAGETKRGNNFDRYIKGVDDSTKRIHPAKPKADLYGEGHIYRACGVLPCLHRQ